MTPASMRGMPEWNRVFGVPNPTFPERALAETQRLRARADNEPRSEHWRREYVQAVAQLQQDLAFPGVEGVFDQALTKGLLVIAAAERPDLLATKNERLPSASSLATGLATVPEVNASAAEEAYERTSAFRHGRSQGGGLTPSDRDLVEHLDHHPALSGLQSELLDLHWAKAEVADHYEVARASHYLDLLDDDEVRRRFAHAKQALTPFVKPGEDVVEPQECPVCELDAMNREGGDDFGHGYVAGTCLVCSYRRSDDIAYELGIDIELRRQLAAD